MNEISVEYTASLREQRGLKLETIALLPDDTPLRIYQRLRAAHALSLGDTELSFVIDEEFSDPHTPLLPGQQLILLAPVSGG